MQDPAVRVRNAKEFAIAFACAVTKITGNVEDRIAKNGDESLYALMKKVFPQVGGNVQCSVLAIEPPIEFFLMSRLRSVTWNIDATEAR
jgi:hypothetical protein